jgi:hypothetical protein
MRFDLPLTAFALESAGAAARALGACHTLTLPDHAAGTSQLPLEIETDGVPNGHRIRIPSDAPPALTITF